MGYDKTINIPALSGGRGIELLDNPDRGLRLEVALNAASAGNPFKSGFNGITDYLNYQYNYYKQDRPKLVQTYFYLSEFEKKAIDASAFDRMQVFLDELRRLGLKAVLRFAYETDFGGPKGPTTEWALKHMEQLAPFLEKNKAVIHVYQAGFIGAWGEWHSSKHKLDQKAILGGILEMVPNDIKVQVRLPLYKNLILKDDGHYKRIGYHDDFIVIEPHEWDGGLSCNSDQYIQMAEEAPFVLVDGELPWGTWSLEKGAWLIDGLGAIKRLAEHRYTSLSLVHNYRENGDEVRYSFANWRETEITEAWLKQNSLHYSSAWFCDQRGNQISKSIFDYICDHLGYRLEALKLDIGETENDMLQVKLDIRNCGFAAPLELKSCEFVIINEKGDIVHKAKACDPAIWHPHAPGDSLRRQLVHSVEAELPLKDLPPACKLGLRICNGCGEGVRLANDITYENGINILSYCSEVTLN